jgi:hypothetical protein
MRIDPSTINKVQGQGSPGIQGLSGVISVSEAFTLPIGRAEITVVLSSVDPLADGQFLYGILPGNITAKIRRAGTQYYLRSLFGQSALAQIRLFWRSLLM